MIWSRRNQFKVNSNYLSHRKQRTKIGSSFSSWFGIYIGVPQGSILGPLLVNVFINDLFVNVVKLEVCNFTDDKTLYSFDKKLETIFSNLKYDLENVLSWFQANSLKANRSKFQFMILGNKQNTSLVLNINGKKINNSREIELLGIVIDNQLKFKKHIESLCKKASCKLHALRRIRKFLRVEKARILANTFINSQFNYALLIWMFASKTAINKTLKIHYRTLQVVYSEYYQKHLRILGYFLRVTRFIKALCNLTQSLCGIVLTQTPFLIT